MLKQYILLLNELQTVLKWMLDIGKQNYRLQFNLKVKFYSKEIAPRFHSSELYLAKDAHVEFTN